MHSKTLVSVSKALDNGRDKLGQVQILAIFLFLLLIPTTAIIAQNATINQTNMTGNLVDVPINIIEVEGNQTNQTNDTLSIPPVNVTIPDGFNQTVNETSNNQTVPKGTDINETDVNGTDINWTDINETDVNGTDTNQTGSWLNETNETVGNELGESDSVEPEPIEPGSPALEARIDSPDRVTRRDTVEISVYATNIVSVPVRSVAVELILPDDFVILTGSGSAHCEEVTPSTSCHTTVTAIVPISSSLGLSDIRSRVTYVE
jgi:hypothetical protein